MSRRLTIKDSFREVTLFRKRMLVVVVALSVLIAIVFWRLIDLQIINHKIYTTRSNKNQLSLIPIEPTRGIIYDRNDKILAENAPAFSLDVIPSKVKDLKRTVAKINKIIPLEQDDIKTFYKLMKRRRSFEPVTLKMKLSPEEVAKFEVNRWSFPGIVINAHLMRNYPLGKSLAHVVGFMGRIDERELMSLNTANYSATNYVGKIGIEKQYEKQLHGTVGYQQVETDASGRVVRVLKRIPPVSGASIKLSVDSDLEIAAQKAFGKENGALVVIKPGTGEILALVSNPSYDPNQFVKGINSKQYAALQHSPDLPLYNRALRGLYALGSTIKPYYAIEGLESNVTTPQYTVYGKGYFKFGNHTYKDWDWRKGGHGWVDLKRAIIVSCDVYFYNLAVNLGIKRIDYIMDAFGFGRSTGIDMGGESIGVVPSSKWKLRHIGTPWYTGDTIITGIGQGYLLATPLQVAQAVATLSERGKQFQPHLLLNMQMPDGTLIKQEPNIVYTLDFASNTWKLIISAMRGVISSKEGTGFRFGHPRSYSVAAKTGTAQVFTVKNSKRILPKKLRDNSLFIAFAPVYHPKVAIAVVVEHSALAPAVARKVLDYYFLHMKNNGK